MTLDCLLRGLASVLVRSSLCGALLFTGLVITSGCSNDGGSGPAGDQPVVEQACEAPADSSPDFLMRVGCRKDFLALASEPLDTSIPGARSMKVVLDTHDGLLYFQNSVEYPIHWNFAAKYLTGPERPIVPSLSQFNEEQYYASDRRFFLAAVTFYEGPQVWALEIAPYDTMVPDQIVTLYDAVKDHAYFGSALAFHPSSEFVEKAAKLLPASVKQKSTDELFAAIDYQPLNLGSVIGKLRFVEAENLATDYLDFRDIVVLDRVPNDISVVSGLITEEFQTPLAHVNVLAQNRKTPNMGLKRAMTNPDLLALKGKWVSFRVGAFDYELKEATQAEADADWLLRKPPGVALPTLNTSITDLRNVEDIIDCSKPLNAAIKQAVLAFGAKATNYGVMAAKSDSCASLASLGATDAIPMRKAFGIPVAYYVQFMQQNGFFEQVDRLLGDPAFQNDPKVRDEKLSELRRAIEGGAVDQNFQTLLRSKLEADYPDLTMRFRTSTNAEDLDGFPCAGCYDSHTGDPADWQGDLLRAIRRTWAGVWFFRTFEERSYNSIDHKGVGMALLVHHNFPEEEANGVALTANPFDTSGLEPGFYVNVQYGGAAEVVHPPPGVTSDEFLYMYGQPGKPVTYLAHSNLISAGSTVLDEVQVLQLGEALDKVHKRFDTAYGAGVGNSGWYAMDVEFKFDGKPGERAPLLVKQARPHPGRGK